MPTSVSPFGPLTVIANPQAGRRRVRAALPVVRRCLEALGLEHHVRLTERPGDASRLARRALEEGSRFLVAMGGDGTVHEVVNGMFDGGDGPVVPEPVLGVVAAGSGCDFIRTFDLPSNAEAAVSRLAGEELRPLDVARMGYLDREGRQASRYFVNIAEAGLGGATAGWAARLPAALGPARYFVAFWLTLPPYRAGSVRLQVDGVDRYQGRAVNVVLANCRYFGGGMQVSPRSQPADAALEVLAFNGPKTDSFTLLPRVYRGRHLPHANIVELAGRHLSLESEQPMEIEADGEVLGTTPATIEVLGSAIRLKV